MYKYDIRGEDFKIGQVKKIGKTIAVIVDKEWLGSRVVVVREGKIKRYEDISDDSRDAHEQLIRRLLEQSMPAPREPSMEMWQAFADGVNKLKAAGYDIDKKLEESGVDFGELRRLLFVKEKKEGDEGKKNE